MSLLEIRGLSKQFGGLHAVEDVSFEVDEGEILGLIGPNGAGKTTVFSLVSGFLRPSRGDIRFMGSSIAGCNPAVICRKGLCRTFQLVRPFADMTVLDNVAVGAFLRVGRLQQARTRAREVLERLEMAVLADRLAATLSTADRKRLEIAKALATEPRILLLDEVMAGLTPRETIAMIDIIRRLPASGVTVVLIEHVMQAVMGLSSRLVVLHHGRKICEGLPEQVANDAGVISAYLGVEDDAYALGV